MAGDARIAVNLNVAYEAAASATSSTEMTALKGC
jgi:hypothetical protein